MTKHFVTFESPGTLFNEETTKEIGAWDENEAQKMARTIIERYGAKPFSFYFTTRERGAKDFDSRETRRSGRYFLGGTLLTLEQVKAQNDPSNETLIRNMECNGWSRVVDNRNSYRSVHPFLAGDTLLDWKP